MERTIISLKDLLENPTNTRTHSKRQIGQIARSIQEFGFFNPILIDENRQIIAGHGRLAAAKDLDLEVVPVIEVRGLSNAKKRALALADNKIADNAGWDRERLAIEIGDLREILVLEGLDISVTGFEVAEIDQLEIDFEPDSSDPTDETSDTLQPLPVSTAGDVWFLGPHRLMCGNARSTEDVDRLMNGILADACVCDPPYNLRISGVVGRGSTKHPEFKEASGEQSPEEFTAFLKATLGNARRVSREGALHYVFMDWRHVGELLSAGRDIYQTHVNTAVWVKSNAGQGSFYRSQHEQVLIFRVGNEQHLNNVELGRYGRNRSNVWSYAGANTFRAGRMEELRLHPTVKPIALVADAIKDCTRRRDVVLDLFAGSGTTILAAERVGRRAVALEIEPRYVDVAIRRWQTFTLGFATPPSRFQDVDSKAPVILTTSQLLTTGVDAPTCKNVVLARVVGSMSEFKQIIGRGTRVRDDYGKLWFNILDYTGSATRLFADAAFDGDPVRLTEEELQEDGRTISGATSSIPKLRQFYRKMFRSWWSAISFGFVKVASNSRSTRAFLSSDHFS